jgi:hypothetical protein
MRDIQHGPLSANNCQFHFDLRLHLYVPQVSHGRPIVRGENRGAIVSSRRAPTEQEERASTQDCPYCFQTIDERALRCHNCLAFLKKKRA